YAAAATKQTKLTAKETTVERIVNEVEVEHEQEPARGLDVEQLELRQGSDDSFGGTQFEALLMPDNGAGQVGLGSGKTCASATREGGHVRWGLGSAQVLQAAGEAGRCSMDPFTAQRLSFTPLSYLFILSQGERPYQKSHG